MKIQEFLREHTTEDLERGYAIAVKRHPMFPNLLMLKYDQIGSPMAEPLVQECRGLILDEARDYAVVNFSFKKFFNAGEPNAAVIDWQTAKVQEKLDGSLCQLYFYGNGWHVASSGLPDASGMVNDSGKSFEQLFDEVWEASRYRLPADRDCCYAFELMTKFNRIVVVHERPRLVLIGVRNLKTLEEVEPESVAVDNGWECVRSFPLTSVEQVAAAAEALDPVRQEGFVVVDANFNRLKVKSPNYVALHHLVSKMSMKGMVDLIRKNEGGEFLAYFPEWASTHAEVSAAFKRLESEIEQAFEPLRSIPYSPDKSPEAKANQKAFAEQAVRFPFAPVLFALRSGSVASVHEALRDMRVESLVSLLGLKEEV